ncbi:hypothetical protein PENTCL1PPCAC_15477, partial [Pristionchus entomophagus]
MRRLLPIGVDFLAGAILELVANPIIDQRKATSICRFAEFFKMKIAQNCVLLSVKRIKSSNLSTASNPS